MVTGSDPTLPGALDEFMKETDQLLEEHDETEEPEEGKDKANAAFARMRKQLKQQQAIMKELINRVSQQPQRSSSQSQGQRNATAGVSQDPVRQRLENVRVRAAQTLGKLLGRMPDFNNPGDVEAMSLLMTDAIAEERASEIVKKMLGPLQSTNLTSLLGRDKDLAREDIVAIQKEISAIPDTQLQVDPTVIQQVVQAYKGRNIDKILARRSATKGKETRKEKAAEDEIEDQDGIFSLQGDSAFSAEKNIFAAEEGRAGASAASGRKSGKGVGLGEAAMNEEGGEKSPPKLSDEDVKLMRKLKLDPSSPTDVEDFRIAKRKKPEKSGLY